MGLVSGIKSAWRIAYDSVKRWLADDAFTLAGALAFYAMLSLAPLIVVLIFIVGMVWGEAAAEGQIVEQTQELVGEDGAVVIQTVVEQADRPEFGTIWAIIGAVVVFVAATGFFAQFQHALNRVWHVEPKPDQGFWSTVRTRLLSFALLLVIGVLLLASMFVSAMLTGAANVAKDVIPGQLPWLGHAIDIIASLVVVTLLFAAIFKYLPDVEIAWRDVWVGATVTAVLFVVGKFAIGLYLGYAGVGSAYGAAGSLAVLLVWIYYSMLIVLLGAEVTQVYAQRKGSRIRPAAYAQPTDAGGPDYDPPPHGRPATGH